MKKFFTFLLGLLPATVLLCQQLHIKTNRYDIPPETVTEKNIVLKMPYANFQVEAVIGDSTAFKNAGDLLVNVVYTDYPAELSLEELNKNRYRQLFQLFPFIKPGQVIQVNFIRQTGGALKENALNMFHGVVIRYRQVQNEATMKNDLNELEKLVQLVHDKKITPTLNSIIKEDRIAEKIEKRTADTTIHKPPYRDPSLNLHGKIVTLIVGDEKKFKEQYDIPDSVLILSPKEALKKKFINQPQYKGFSMGLYDRITFYKISPEAEPSGEINEETKPFYTDTTTTTPPVPDSTLFSIFKRNSWKNIAVVGDVTGSMFPYTGQLLIWLKLHDLDKLTNKFVFFNDGDNKPDEKKKTGRTGGIYFKECNAYSEVEALLKSTMQKGYGGDIPENNIEALLLAEKEYPGVDHLVLIADNRANIKDISLISKLTKPVRVILCGTSEYLINTDYLNLAYKTKGSLHLIEKDIYTLSQVHEGAIIVIGKKSFRLKNGGFTEIDSKKE
ncbi:MAG: hypothetical protein QM791_19615 [Ferruginibacter sp.]